GCCSTTLTSWFTSSRETPDCSTGSSGCGAAPNGSRCPKPDSDVSRPLSGFRRALDAATSILIAPACASCGQLLDSPTSVPGCGGCWRSVVPLPPPLCDRCGDPLPAWREISLPLALCPRCRRQPRSIVRARAVGEYDGALRAIVHAIKYDGRRSLARP